MRDAVPILLYHSVDDRCAPSYRPYAVPIAAFQRQMAALADLGCSTVTVSELAALRRERRQPPSRAIAITFDDGLRDFALGAIQTLLRHGFCATLFVATGFVGGTGRWLRDLGEGDRPMLGWGEIRDLANAGVEIGAHSINHLQLDLLPRDEAIAEIEGSKRAIEDNLKRCVQSFAYPHGYSSPATRGIAKRAGFSSACRVGNGVGAPDEDLYALSRVVVDARASYAEIRNWVTGRGAPIARSPDSLAALGWRLMRGLHTWGRERRA
jgi:O-antigen biosynthesis protein